MAARKGKSQARRNHGGDHGLPGWAWLVLGMVLTAIVLLLVPKLLHKGDGDGFFRPTPNPDAQPASVPEDEAVVATDARPAARTDAGGETPPKDTRYDFYTLLPSDEVPMSDAELEATARAEAARAAQPQPQPAEAAAGEPPQQVAVETADRADRADRGQPAPSATQAAPAAGSDTPYLLQAGAFGASGDAEALKARIALLGLSARVESAQIGDKTVYRVRMGPYGSASELAEAKRKLATGGLPALAIKAK